MCLTGVAIFRIAFADQLKGLYRLLFLTGFFASVSDLQ